MKKHLLYQLANGRWEAFVPTRYSLCGDQSVAQKPENGCLGEETAAATIGETQGPSDSEVTG
jgi:hypothetical protein